MHHLDDGPLHAYLDGELIEPGDDPRELELHLESCAACQARLAEVRAMRGSARALLDDPLPIHAPPFESVLARARRPAPPRGWIPARLAPLAWAASLVVALGAGWLARDLLRQAEDSRVAVAEPRGQAAPAPAPAAPLAMQGAANTAAATAPREARVMKSADAQSTLATAQADQAPQAAQADQVALAAPPPPRAAARGVAAVSSEDFSGVGKLSPEPSAEGAAWTPVDRAGAEGWLGRPLATVPGLTVLGIESGATDGAPALRVRQELGDGRVLTLLLRRAQGAPAAAPRSMRAQSRSAADALGEAELTVRQGELMVTGRAALPADSLRRVLERIR